MFKFVKLALLSVVCAVSIHSVSIAGPKKALPGDKDFKTLLPGRLTGNTAMHRSVDSAYQSIHLNAYGLSKEVFFNAFKGYNFLLNHGMLTKKNILTIVDYTQSSHNKRLYVIDLAQGKVVYNTYVSHGKNSGSEYANSFSNYDNSNKSSLGFIVTGSPYHGKAGLSLHLDGIESGINDHMYRRSIVLHGSHYVNKDRADEGTMMGRSLGCPAVPYGEQFAIIDYIKEGSCVFIAGNNSEYMMDSKVLNS